MKKSILMIAALCMGLAACHSNSNSSGSSDTSISKPGAVAGDTSVNNVVPAGAANGAGLMAASDCNTCHKADIKIVGPAFKDIAAKYTQADADRLTEKVIKGGSGLWGSAAMNPHPALKKEDVKAMVNYILAQK
jgi:cytochrome c